MADVRKRLKENVLIFCYSTDWSFLFSYPSRTAYEVMKEVTLLFWLGHQSGLHF